MPEIIISIENKEAQLRAPATIVNGNSDYTVRFMFDSEWDDYEEKTAEFRYWRSGERKKDEVLFSGDTVSIPILRDIDEVEIGVYAGNLHTSTGARIPCARSITDGDAVHDPPTPDVYNQLMEYLAGIQSGGAQVGNAVPALYGTAMSRIGSWDYPLLQGTLGTPINGMIGGLVGDAISWDLTPESSYYSIRALIPELYRIPAGKTATVSVSGNDIGIFGIYCTKDQIVTERIGAVQASPAVFSNTSEDDIYFVPRFCIASDDSAQITPSDVGTVMAVLE